MIVRLIKYIRKIGWKKFKEEYNEKKLEEQMKPINLIKGQIVGLWISLIFSIVSIVIVLVYNRALWTLAGVFLGASIIQFFQLKGFYVQLQQIKTIEELSNSFQEEVKV